MLQVIPPLGMLAGLVFVALGLRLIRTGRRLRSTGVHVQGVVVRLRWEPGENNGGLFYPLLRFQTTDGRMMEIESDVGSTPPPAREGSPVAVVHRPAPAPGRAGSPVAVVSDPATPSLARLASMLGRGPGLGMIFVAFGLTAA